MIARRVAMLVAILALGLAVQAQAHGKKGRLKHHGGHRIKAALDLNAEQLAQVEVLKAQHRAQRQVALLVVHAIEPGIDPLERAAQA